MAKPDASAEILRKYLGDKKIVVVDPGSSSRQSVQAILVQLGAKAMNISAAKTFSEGVDEIKAKDPMVVVAEYNLGKQSGLELMQGMREGNNKDNKKRLFFLLTGNTSQSAVARAAEEDIDGFILKPFSPETFKQQMVKAALLKIQPPAYLLEIEEGKTKLEGGDFPGAEAHFQKALTMDPQPALAFYYLGQVKYIQKVLDQSKGSYMKGLDFNKIHYRCLVGLFELLMAQKIYDQAYEVVKKLSAYFPANPKRLAEVLRLAIINKAYDDVEKYYAAFTNIDERNEMLVKFVCAALVVCGKYYLMTGNRSRALELFQKAAVTSAGRLNILIEILKCLVEFRLGNEAVKFMTRVPPDSKETPEVLNMDFQIESLTAPPAAAIIKGRKLQSQGIANEKSWEILVKLYIEMKSMSAAEDAAGQAITKFPAIRPIIEELIKKAKAAG